MIGLGAQELILLGILAVPVIAAVVLLAYFRKKKRRDDADDADW